MRNSGDGSGPVNDTIYLGLSLYAIKHNQTMLMWISNQKGLIANMAHETRWFIIIFPIRKIRFLTTPPHFPSDQCVRICQHIGFAGVQLANFQQICWGPGVGFVFGRMHWATGSQTEHHTVPSLEEAQYITWIHYQNWLVVWKCLEHEFYFYIYWE